MCKLCLMSWTPRKLGYLGVVGGIKSWCKEFAERQNIEIDFKSLDVSSALPPEIGLSLFRVLQEAFHNAVKHSGGRRVEVQLRENWGEVHLVISDLGRGFDLEAGTARPRSRYHKHEGASLPGERNHRNSVKTNAWH